MQALYSMQIQKYSSLQYTPGLSATLFMLKILVYSRGICYIFKILCKLIWYFLVGPLFDFCLLYFLFETKKIVQTYTNKYFLNYKYWI